VQALRLVQNLEKHMPGKVSPELMKRATDEYEQVKSQFSNSKGKVRQHWSNKSLKQMAEEVGLLSHYEVAYGAASDLHHMPFTGVIGHELNWLREALYVAHGAFLGTAVALYNVVDVSGTEFGDRLDKAIANLHKTRKK
jgi:VIT1/CCC1 family predicted Fe2+/Mn2+ transporter